MKQAGLTVGGFYKHFASRDELVAEAMGLALGGWKRKIEAAASGGPRVTYESPIDDYLSEAHPDNPAAGCPVGALAGECVRSDKRTRSLVSQEAQDNIKLLTTFFRKRGADQDDEARARAIMAYCALVGAITMSRAVSDQLLSREILKSVARRLKS
jgi:TetR/AcrR family transcriptional regulator, transcriptional repressor for nem operon